MDNTKPPPMTETIEGNKLIAEFDSSVTITKDKIFKYRIGEHKWAAEGLKYHSSWDWLMPIVDKIANEEELLVDFKVSDYHPYFEKIKTALSFVNIKSVWESVIDFITWYNTQSK